MESRGFHTDLGIGIAVDLTPNKDYGVLKEVLWEGEGERRPLAGDTVLVHYVGLMKDASPPCDPSRDTVDGMVSISMDYFESSRDRGEPFSFTLGKGEVIKAWDMILPTMRKGELARLTCHSTYACGDQAYLPKIPHMSSLMFEIELLGWCSEDLSQTRDGGIVRSNVTLGEGFQTPNDGALLDVHVIGRVNGTVFDERDLKFPLGEGCEHNIPEGLETALEKFKKGEKSIVKLSPEYTFGGEGNPSLGVPPGASVEYEAELHSFEKAKEPWEMDQAEKVEQGKTCKDKGTQFLKAEKYKLAVKQYKKIIDLLEFDAGLDDEKKAESHKVLLAGHLNLSMVYLKLKDNASALEHASKAVTMDSANVKAYFRRGQAHLNIGDALVAQKDFQSCLDLEPGNKAAQQQLSVCVQQIKAHRQKEKQLYGGMFEKFVKQDMVKDKDEPKTIATEVLSDETTEVC